MKEGWEIKKLKDVCSYDKEIVTNPNLPYVGLEHIESKSGKFMGTLNPTTVKSSTFHFTEKHVLYGRLRPYLNKVFLPFFEGHCSTEIFPISVTTRILREYLYYWFLLDSTVKKIDATRTGARMPRANMTQVSEFEIPLPPISEQKRIVALLDELLSRIDKARENIEKNIENAEELYQRTVIDLFSNSSEDWETKKLEEVCSIISDGTHHTPKYFDSGYIFLSSRNVTSGVIDWEDVKYIDETQHISMQKRVSPRVGDILLAKNGTTGVAALVDRDVDFDIYVSLALLRPLDFIDPTYLLYVINSPFAKRQFNARLKGMGVPNLHLEEIREVTIQYPKSKERQREIVEKISALLQIRNNLKENYTQKLQALDELRNSLLEKAFRGELT